MENLQIKDERCPDCGSITVHIYQAEASHCNGTKEETREYACGKTLRYSTNFKEIQELYGCTRTSVYLEKQKRIEDNVIRVIKYMKKTLKMNAEDCYSVIKELYHKDLV